MKITALEIQKQIEERIRIERIKNVTRACKDRMYEVLASQEKKK